MFQSFGRIVRNHGVNLFMVSACTFGYRYVEKDRQMKNIEILEDLKTESYPEKYIQDVARGYTQAQQFIAKIDPTVQVHLNKKYMGSYALTDIFSWKQTPHIFISQENLLNSDKFPERLEMVALREYNHIRTHRSWLFAGTDFGLLMGGFTALCQLPRPILFVLPLVAIFIASKHGVERWTEYQADKWVVQQGYRDELIKMLKKDMYYDVNFIEYVFNPCPDAESRLKRVEKMK